MPPRPHGLGDWLAVGQLPCRMRYRRNAGPMLLIDQITRQFHGPAALKRIVDGAHAALLEGLLVRGGEGGRRGKKGGRF